MTDIKISSNTGAVKFVNQVRVSSNTGNIKVTNTPAGKISLNTGKGVDGIAGPQGVQGSQGFQGVPGSQGPIGAQGVQGVQGSQGFQGVQGVQGAQGVQGHQGFQGVQGHQGFQGVQGHQGFQGVQGHQGFQGVQGHQGYQGVQGADGAQGAQGHQGFQGAQGVQGHQGFQGVQGHQGFQGVQGHQGFQGVQGVDGAQGVQGHQGFQGVQGHQGFQGVQGHQGYQGHQGFQGAQGVQGHQGFQGVQGHQGYQGAQGVEGAQGVQGHQGFQGADGNFGGVTFDYTFDTDITNTDPGTGKLKFDNANISLATEMYIDDTNDGFVDIQTYLRTIDDSTSTIKGHFRISNRLDSTDFALFTISGTTENSGYFTVTCSYVSGSATSFSNGEDVIITFARTGDKGDTGAPGAQGAQGHQGFQGVQGSQGFQGDQGVQGAQGVQGHQGFQGVQGVDGAQGVQGHQGFQGVQGVDGAQGVQGHQGFQGVQGHQGFQGVQGADGAQGVQGHQGYQGVQGADGAQGVQGHQGFQGVQGHQGYQGVQGADGAQGVQGHQGYQGVQGHQGFQGVQGHQGYQGVQGADGAQGVQGHQGVQGVQGVEGAQGVQGHQGFQGVQGIEGAQGVQGHQGFQGVQGHQGYQGVQGADGAQGVQGHQGYQGVQGHQGFQGVQGIEGAQGVQGATGLNGVSSGLLLYFDSATVTSPPTANLNVIANTATGTTVTVSGLSDASSTLIGTFVTAADLFTTYPTPAVISGVWKTILYAAHSAGGQNTKFWIEVDEVQSDGTTLISNIASGSFASGTTVTTTTTTAYTYDLSVPTHTISSSSSRISVKIYAQLVSAGSPTSLIVHLRNSTLSSILTTIATNLIGPQGAAGAQGVQGAVGAQGVQGHQGYQGVQGADGAQGVQGHQGFQGVQGHQGFQGVQGHQGYQGVQGADGAQGVQGAVGAQGVQGVAGAQGVQGATGTFSGTLTSDINANGFSILNANVIQANTFSGTITIGNVNSIQFNTAFTPAAFSEGLVYWDTEKGTLAIDLNSGSGITQQVGEDQYIWIKANTNLTKGRVVQFVGVQGDTILADHANTTSAGFIPRYVIGVVPADITAGQFGYVQTVGEVFDLNTSGLPAGSILYLQHNSDGILTATEPTPPNPRIVLAACLTESVNPATNGRIQVRPDFGYFMKQLHDVANVTPNTNDVLVYSSGGVWTPRNSAPLANVVSHNAQPNITSVGTLTGLTVSGITNLGPNGNVIITGGSSGYVLSTDGSGNLSWVIPQSGAQGVQGAVGAQGVQGAAGAQGVQGAAGAQGVQGAAGAQGVQGAAGAQGVQGAVGAQGADGGQLTAGNYVVRANKDGTTQTVTNGADAVVTFIDDFDPQGWFASNKFQPTIAGYYSLDVSVWWNAGAVTNNQTNIQIRKNGTTQLAIDQAQIVTGSGYGQSLSTIAYFNGTTDYVEVTAFTGNTTSQDINGAAGGTFFAAALYAYGPPGAQGAQGAPGSGGVANFPVSANSGSTVTANGINFVNTSGITISTTSGVTGNANVSITANTALINAINDVASTLLYPIMVPTPNVESTARVTSSKLYFDASTGTIYATAKSFDIEHPSKENMRLRYGSLEGPENGVYFRGRTSDSKIVLPDHWNKLIDPDSITVQLTPIGSPAVLSVDYIDGNVIHINKINGGEYYFIIFAERIDIPKLTIEYREDGITL